MRDVQEYTVGDTLRVGEINGRIGSGEIVSIDEHIALVRVHGLSDAPPPALPCTLIIALPRPKMLKRILVDATTMGVKRICFINSWRVEKSFWSSPLLMPDSVDEKLRLGLAQCVDTVLPVVTFHSRFRPFVEDELPAISAGTRALVAHPSAPLPCPHSVDDSGESRDSACAVTLAIGPEGGFTPFEVELLQTAARFTPVTLGPRILRVDTAIPSLLGRLFVLSTLPQQ